MFETPAMQALMPRCDYGVCCFAMPLAAGCHGFLANNCLIRLELMPQCLRSSNKRRLPRRPQAAGGPSLRRCCCCCCMHTYAYVLCVHGTEWTVPGERQARQRLAGMLGERLHAVREHTEACLRSSGVASVTTPRMRIHAQYCCRHKPPKRDGMCDGRPGSESPWIPTDAPLLQFTHTLSRN